MSARRFAITASDRYIGIFKAFVECGWEPVKLFAFPTDDHASCNKLALEFVQTRKIPIQMSRMDDDDLADLQSRGCELLVLASYPWRIGNWQGFVRRAVNFHPTLLPNCRGPFPQVQAILDRQTQWATSCLKVAPDFDTGDILAARTFPIAPYECFESLDLKTQMQTRQLALGVAQNLDALWEHATAQGAGQYVKLWTEAQRVLDFNASVAEIDRQLRAFGPMECIAHTNNLTYFVRRAACWQAAHSYAPHFGACGRRSVCAGLLGWFCCSFGMESSQCWHQT